MPSPAEPKEEMTEIPTEVFQESVSIALTKHVCQPTEHDQSTKVRTLPVIHELFFTPFRRSVPMLTEPGG